jgi:hypothetical protein
VDQVSEFAVLLLQPEVLAQRLAGIRHIGGQGTRRRTASRNLPPFAYQPTIR